MVNTLLAQAPQNFAALRLARSEYDTDFARYKVKPLVSRVFGTHCRACTLDDQYARGTYKENWYVEDRWDTPAKWNPAKTEAYAVRSLRPGLSGFALHRTVPKYSKYPTLLWRGSANRWVYVDTFEGGFTIRVGHDLTTPVHVLKPPSRAQISQLMTGTANIIRLGDPAGASNFQDLRLGAPHKDIINNDEYDLNVTFGPMFHPCTVTSVMNGFGYKDFQPKWILECKTIAIAGTNAQWRGTMRDAVSNVLPSGYEEDTNASDLLLDDYMWQSQQAQQSIDILPDERDGTVRFTVSIYHFLPRDTGTSN